jgi:hypothetical protein
MYGVCNKWSKKSNFISNWHHVIGMKNHQINQRHDKIKRLVADTVIWYPYLFNFNLLFDHPYLSADKERTTRWPFCYLWFKNRVSMKKLIK